MKLDYKIIVLNLIILVGYNIFLYVKHLEMLSSPQLSWYVLIVAFFMGIHLCIILLITIILAILKRPSWYSWFLSLWWVLLVGFSTCWGGNVSLEHTATQQRLEQEIK